MKLAVLDINGSRARAVAGADGSVPQVLPLDDTRAELATSIRVDGRRSEPGQAAVAICRQYPHLTEVDYLWKLGQEQIRHHGARSAEQALAVLVNGLRGRLSGCDRLCLCLPGYLSESQAAQCRMAFAKTRLRIVAAIPSPVALAVAARGEDEDLALVTVEVDTHGLALGYVEAGENGVRMADQHLATRLSANAWWDAMLNGIAETCIRQNRRDFRDSGAAEQGVFGQLDDVISAASRDELIEVVIRTKQWCQNLILRPEQINAMCEPLAVRAAQVLAEWLPDRARGRPCRAIVSDEVARWPGLKGAIQTEMEGTEVVEISTTKALCRLHAQSTQWSGDPGGLWSGLPPASAPVKSNNERPRSLRIRWR